MTTAYVIGTADTKGAELSFVADVLQRHGITVHSVDISTGSTDQGKDTTAAEVAACHPSGANAVIGLEDRGTAVTAMAEALSIWLSGRSDVDAVIGLGGSGGSAMIAPAMQQLPIGIPKLLVSTVASGNVSAYVGTSDITMVYPVVDISGLNSISRRVLANAAGALAGMLAAQADGDSPDDHRGTIALTMFGVTTPCVQAVSYALQSDYECLVFHATGVGGRSMEKLVDSGAIEAVVDISTTEILDHIVGGTCDAGSERLSAILRCGTPWIGSVGALDMVNFREPASVPSKFAGRLFHQHNPSVTLMRASAEEMAAAGRWLAEKINLSPGPVRLVIPEGGVSMLDAPGQPFHAPDANEAMINAIEESFQEKADHKLVKAPLHINDPSFASLLVEEVRSVLKT
ncbi:Tm-1-like ATP-binding domain-containing protein [Fodinicurvata halophila]|uniref:Tm-1-like ATP-binding domain-containing protein n=1 Tax=Fodinicurvata halophila TaxID=1419723 RepID=A0ABV8UI80_9PROT